MPRPADTYTHDQSEDLLTNAVQHSFLAYVGSGSLSENDFNQWLAQIGYISRSLVPFTIALIGKIRIPETENLEHNSTFRCLDLLCSAITNMKKELGFLEATKREYGLEVGLDELRLATKSFIAPLQFLLTISSQTDHVAKKQTVRLHSRRGCQLGHHVTSNDVVFVDILTGKIVVHPSIADVV
ncbi:unnamed protein product, partial [Fusarium graminearum]